MNRDCHGDFYGLRGFRFYRCLADGTTIDATELTSGNVCRNCQRKIDASEAGEVSSKEVLETWVLIKGRWYWHSHSIIEDP